ncbi:MAG TPA: glycosyltransferase family A protein [Syntrophales bacterium]|nr:glycosyltransferase family A protein [Syntrophales bacterium]
MAHPKVSVIMAVYNEERYLRGALESILNQTFADFELLIVNDGSTDGTEEIIRSCRDSRIRLFNQENKGLTKSLNRALSLARANYFARMDGDDISQPQRFARQVEILDNNPTIGLVGSFVYRMDEKGGRCNLCSYPMESEGIREALWSTCPLCHPSVMYRRACVERVGPYREKVGPSEDLDFYFRVSEHFDVANISEPLLSYRVRPEGITMQRRFDQLRYGRLVRKMAEERRQTGRDSLDDMSEDQVARLLEQFLPRTPENERKVIEAICINLAEIAYVTGNYGRAARWLTKHMVKNLRSRRGWLLAAKLAVCSVVEKNALQHIIAMGSSRSHGRGYPVAGAGRGSQSGKER